MGNERPAPNLICDPNPICNPFFRYGEGFRKGTTNVLVTTDSASRGLDVEDVDLVINVEM